MTVPAVSIVIPCYNAARWLGETLQSVATQTFKDYELIVVDDGSTDESMRVVAKSGMAAQILSGPNQGVSKARIRGAEAARGKYLLYLDADDLLTPNTLMERVQRAEATGADIIYCAYQRLEPQKGGGYSAAPPLTPVLAENDPEAHVLWGFWVPPAALLYRRSTVERMPPWSSTLPVIEDARFLLDAAHCGARFVRVESSGALYRIHRSGSLSSEQPRRFTDCILRNAEEVEARWRATHSLNRRRSYVAALVYGTMLRSCCERNERELAERAANNLLRVERNWRWRRGHLVAHVLRHAGFDVAKATLRFLDLAVNTIMWARGALRAPPLRSTTFDGRT